MQRQRRILGHVIRADPADPMSSVSFTDEYEVVVTEGRRPGRPRQQFLEQNIQSVYWDLFEELYDETDEQQRTNLVAKAFSYDF